MVIAQTMANITHISASLKINSMSRSKLYSVIEKRDTKKQQRGTNLEQNRDSGWSVICPDWLG